MQRKPENRTQGKAITPNRREAFALIADKWALRLRQHRQAQAPSRIDARTIRELDRDMLEFSRWKQPTPIAMIYFNRMTRMLLRGKSGQPPERSTTKSHAEFIALLASGQHFTNGQLAKRLKVSKPAIARWRSQESINAFLEKVNEISPNRGGSPDLAMVEDSWKRVPHLESSPETCTCGTDENGEPHSVVVRVELSTHVYLRLQRQAMETGSTISEVMARIVHAHVNSPQVQRTVEAYRMRSFAGRRAG